MLRCAQIASLQRTVSTPPACPERSRRIDSSRASPLDLFEQPAKGFFSILLGKKKLANAKLEIRISKQIGNSNKPMLQTSFNISFLNFGHLDLFRISIFEFRILFRLASGAMNLSEVVLLNI
jgi:hypothetical protein